MSDITRDDSMLNTGLSSASERRLIQKQAELHNKRKDEKEAMRSSLTKQGETIMEWIDQEIADAKDLTKMILNIRTEDDVRAQLLAKQMHLKFLQDAKHRVKMYMREPKIKDNKTEGFGNE